MWLIFKCANSLEFTVTFEETPLHSDTQLDPGRIKETDEFDTQMHQKCNKVIVDYKLKHFLLLVMLGNVFICCF